jgi:hypothetical protein
MGNVYVYAPDPHRDVHAQSQINRVTNDTLNRSARSEKNRTSSSNICTVGMTED